MFYLQSSLVEFFMNAKVVILIATVANGCSVIATSAIFNKYYDRVRANSSTVQQIYSTRSSIECVHMCTKHECCKVVSYSKHVFGTCTLHCHDLTKIEIVSDLEWTTFVDKGERC